MIQQIDGNKEDWIQYLCCFVDNQIIKHVAIMLIDIFNQFGMPSAINCRNKRNKNDIKQAEENNESKLRKSRDSDELQRRFG